MKEKEKWQHRCEHHYLFILLRCTKCTHNFLFQGIKLFLLNKQVLIDKYVNALFITNPEKEGIPYNCRRPGKKQNKSKAKR